MRARAAVGHTRQRARWRTIAGITLLVVATGAVARPPGAAGPGYVLGVFPYLPPARLERLYAPVARALGEKVGAKVRLRTRSTFARFREALAESRYDVVFIQPFDYVRVGAAAGYRPLARWEGQLQALVVTREDSRVRRLAALRGRRVAMPPREAAVSILGQALLARRGLAAAVDVVHLRNHFACMSQVAARTAAACVTAISPLRQYRARFGAPLRVVAASEGIATSLFAVHGRVPAAAAEAFRDTIVGWHRSEEGRALLGRLGYRRFIVARDEEYDAVRRIWRLVAGEGT